MSLPEVYSSLVADQIAAFPALRPHQRHAWHAFLCQLGTIALHQVGLQDAVDTEDEWRKLLRETTPAFADDQPWRLVVDAPGQPAFLQCPSPQGLGQFSGMEVHARRPGHSWSVPRTTTSNRAPLCRQRPRTGSSR